MELAWIAVATVVNTVVSLEIGLIFARFIAEMIFPDSEGKIIEILYCLTEPLVAPVRGLLSKIPALEELPIDFSFFVTGMLLSLIMLII